VSAIVNVIASKDGTQIAYEQRGDGPPLVVVDGALSTRMSGSGQRSSISSRPSFRCTAMTGGAGARAGRRSPTPSSGRSRTSTR
jgi:hypothetical protein